MDTQRTAAIAEEYIEGRELYVGVLGNERLRVLPIWQLEFGSMAESARRIATEEFDVLIAATYNDAAVGAAALADDLSQDVDLARLLQEIPKVEDLLESKDDAPVIRGFSIRDGDVSEREVVIL